MFDLKRLQANRLKAQTAIQYSSFYQFVCNDLLSRLAPIDREFNKILLISPILEEIFHKQLKNKYRECDIMSIDFQNMTIQNEKFDLVIFPMGLQWVIDVQHFLKLIYKCMQPDGLFICNFAGGGTLSHLRRNLVELEEKFTRKYSPHISPFIQFEHLTPLLQQAGFIENIIDMETIELEYESALALMHALKKAGEGNALENKISYSITKKMHQCLAKKPKDGFLDVINLISFISGPQKRSITLHKKPFDMI
jgi:SAM-dependent methyltransferase